MNELLHISLIVIAAILMLLHHVTYKGTRNSDNRQDRHEELSNLAAWALTLAVGHLCIPLITPLYHWAYRENFALLNFFTVGPAAMVAKVVLAIVLYDFLYYWYHRFSHAFAPLWNAHAVHHQASHLTPSLGLKSSVLDFAIICLVTIPMVLIGFDSQSLIIALGIHAIYQLFLHHQLPFTLGPLEAVFNSHNHHALHHATNKQYLDTNFASILIIWDRLFGTFAKQQQRPNIGILGRAYPKKGGYVYDPILCNLMPWLPAKFQLKHQDNHAGLMIISYSLALILILSWLFLKPQSNVLLYSLLVLLIIHSALQLILQRKKTA